MGFIFKMGRHRTGKWSFKIRKARKSKLTNKRRTRRQK
jgi:hypothetical protein